MVFGGPGEIEFVAGEEVERVSNAGTAGGGACLFELAEASMEGSLEIEGFGVTHVGRKGAVQVFEGGIKIAVYAVKFGELEIGGGVPGGERLRARAGAGDVLRIGKPAQRAAEVRDRGHARDRYFRSSSGRSPV